MNKKGFTLIELLLALVIVSVLLLIAFPSYTSYIEKTHAENVKKQMFDISFDMDRVKGRYYTYTAALNSDGDFDIDTNLLRYPKSLNEEERFTLEVIDVTDTEFKIIATPTATQGLNYGKIRLYFDGEEMKGEFDIDNDNSWSERWY